jgi:hypothetical protein
LKLMMAVWGMHLDFAPDVAGGALFPYLESMANLQRRSPGSAGVAVEV